MQTGFDLSTPYDLGLGSRADLTSARLLIEAPSGYGKSRLLHQLALARGDVVYVEDLDALRQAAADLPSTTTLIADELETWADCEHIAVARFITFERPEQPLVLASRACASQLRDAIALGGGETLGIDELRVNRDFFVDALGDHQVGGASADERAALLDRLCDGWPALARLVVDLVRSGVPGISVLHPLVNALVEECVGVLVDADLRRLEQLAHLDSFSPAVVNALDAGLFDRVRRAGVPLQRSSSDGTLRLIDPVRETLRYRAPLVADVSRTMAVALLKSAMPLGAIQLLIRAGESDVAADLLVGLTTAQLEAIAPDELLTTLDVLRKQFATHPRLHLVRGRAFGATADLAAQEAALRLAIDAATTQGDEVMLVEASAEHLHAEAMRAERTDSILAEIDALIATCPRSESMALLLDARGLVLARSERPDDVRQAIEFAGRAAIVWETLGARFRTRATLRTQAMTMLMPAGRLLEARARIDHALALTPIVDLERLSTLVVAIRLDSLLAEPIESRLSEAGALAAGLKLGWAEGYVYWARAIHAGVHRRPHDVAQNMERAWHLLGQLRGHRTGALLLAECTEAMARAGDLDAAGQLLSRCLDRRAECRREAFVADLAVTARRGDHERIDFLLAGTTVLTGWDALRWKQALYRTIAHGEGPTAAESVRRATTLAEPYCGAGLIERLEPGLLATSAVRAVDTPGANSAAPPPTRPANLIGRSVATERGDPSRSEPGTVRVHVLGSFGVWSGDRQLPPPSERVASLIKAVALGRGRLPVEVAIDRLWPDAAEPVGRRRLKNLLSRVRKVYGGLIERDAQTLRFGAGVELDLVRYSDACRNAARAFADGEDSAAALAVQALEHYNGPLLPDDLYDDGVAPIRVTESARAMAVLDKVLDSTTSPTVGPALLEALIRIDAEDVVMLHRLLSWAAERDHGLARSVAMHLAAVHRELGGEPPRDVTRWLAADPGTSGAPALNVGGRSPSSTGQSAGSRGSRRAPRR